ncbi:hypothetical protein [Candidatus Lokiarchaeum ossiferum]|uniref:hypothetical protein n=1 Tax=Candidatus Lokiarchaeum ossiferum TaxID=2951803 RepID=UPI00352EA54F
MKKYHKNLEQKEAKTIDFRSSIVNFFHNRKIQKIFLIGILCFSLTLLIISPILTYQHFSGSTYFLPLISGLLSFGLFFFFLSIYFIVYFNDFDPFFEKLLEILRIWAYPLIIIVVNLIFSVIFILFNLDNDFYFLNILPIFPFYLITILFQTYKSPTLQSSLSWAAFFNFLILIPFYVFILNKLGKSVLKKSLINGDKAKDNEDRAKVNEIILKSSISEREKQSFFKAKIILCFLSILIAFSILFNAVVGYDTTFYFTFVKDFFTTGNLDLLLNPESRSAPYTIFSFEFTFWQIPIVILLIGFSTICGKNILLGSLLMNIILFSSALLILINLTYNITNNTRISIWAGILFMFSSPIHLLFAGLYKQLLSVVLVLFAIYLISIKTESRLKRRINIAFASVLFLILSVTYLLTLGIVYLIIVQYIYRKSKTSNLKINRFFLILQKLFLGLPIILLLVFIFGYPFKLVERLFSIPFMLFFTNEQPLVFQSFAHLTFNIANFCYYGIGWLFMILGIMIDFQKKTIRNREIRIFMIIFLESVAVFLFVSLFGVDFYAHRLVSFIPIFGSVFASIGIVECESIFPKFFTNRRRLKKKYLQSFLLASMVISFPFSVPFYRNAYLIDEELEALEWFHNSPDLEKLMNKNTSDINIVCNKHLINPVRYYIHYNTVVDLFDSNSIASLINHSDYYALRNQAQEKLYIIISEFKEPFAEDWDNSALISFIDGYRLYCSFTWTNHTINDVVTIWEIEYT